VILEWIDGTVMAGKFTTRSEAIVYYLTTIKTIEEDIGQMIEEVVSKREERERTSEGR